MHPPQWQWLMCTKKNKKLFLWFFQLCISGGMQLHRFALFVDRGFALDAACDMAYAGRHQGDVTRVLSLKYCSLHELHNAGQRSK